VILVIGATGPTGSATVRELVRRGVDVRALTRDRAKAGAIPELAGAEIAVGDSSRPETLDGVFAGAEKVYLVPPLAPGWNAMQTGLIEAARRAGVRHLVKISAIGVGPDEPSMSLTYHWQGEQELEASGIPFTHVRGNSFSQNTLYEAATIKGENRFYDCVGEARFAKVDTRDIGEVVAKVLTEDGHEGRTYELTGPDPLTYAEMARRLSAALGREIEYVDLSVAERAAQLEAAGIPDWMAREFSSIYGQGFYGAGGGATTTGTIEQLLGRPPRPFDDFARDYAGAFS
jgi:uncharacterized protein YbjT (DUF2867 family)